MEKKTLWKEVTGWLYKSVLIYSLAGILGSVLSVFSITSAIGEAANGNIVGAADSFDTADTIIMIANIAILAGYALFFVYAGKFRELLSGDDAKAAASMRTAHLLLMVSALLLLLPIPGLIALIVEIVAWFMMLSACGKLMNSTNIPELAATGMKKVRLSMILSLIGGIISIIPIIGIVGAILSLVAFFINLSGWSKVAQSEI